MSAEGCRCISNLWRSPQIGQILTAAVATIAYVRYALAQRSRRRALETYLREEKLRDFDQGKRTVMHLMAHLAMTEAEVLHAGFKASRL